MRPSLLALHTSDVHITDDERTHEVLGAVVDLALAVDADLVIIAGDLFDHARVTEETIAVVIGELSRLNQRTLVIPGNHDCLGDGSLYDRVDLTKAGAHVTFIDDPAGAEVVFPELEVAIWGRGIELHTPQNRPLLGYRIEPTDYWRIAVAHGHYFRTDEAVDRSSPIRQEEIAGLDCDYLALGHWHRFRDVSAGSVSAFYCGSPTEGDARGVNLVRFDEPGGVQVEWRALAAAEPSGRLPIS